MVTAVDLVVELVVSVFNLVRIFLLEVFLGVDPLTAILFLVGAALTTAAIGVFGYLAAGAALNLFTGSGASAPDAEPEEAS